MIKMTMMKKKIKKTNRRNIQFMAAAVLSAALISGQALPVIAENSSSVIRISSIIPDNITIEVPVALSEIPLPESDYGKLSWADDTQVPSKRSEAFKVEFKPSKYFDLSQIELLDDMKWDDEEGVLISYVTVVVSSISQTGEDDSGSEYYEPDDFYEEESDSKENNPEDESLEEEISGAEGSTSDDADATADDALDAVESIVDESDSDEVTEENAGAEEIMDKDSDGESLQDETDSNQDDSAENDIETDNSAGENADESEKSAERTESQDDGTDSSEKNTGEGNGEIESAEEEIPDNIFDRVDEDFVDERPTVAGENPTEEEMAQYARENHTCDGIFVSGINLPWYVQFRATSGESYEFTNESQANIFRSYEFELWDLKNDTEYEIPDGEYISVTIPVKEGYEYTIEHLLDNGATETIIPSVTGNIMIFSTHSFSPFGIAGSRTLVGEEGVENNYATPTPTAVPTKTPTKAPANSGSGSSSGSNGSTGTASNTGSNGSSGTGSSTGTAENTGSGSSNGTNSGNISSSIGSSDTGSSASNASGVQNSGNTQDSTSTDAKNSAGVKAVQTGDDTQILPFVILVIAAIIIIGAVLILKRKKK